MFQSYLSQLFAKTFSSSVGMGCNPPKRNLGIFYENAVNRILRDIVKACRPVWARVTGTFAARGGLRSVIEAKYPS